MLARGDGVGEGEGAEGPAKGVGQQGGWSRKGLAFEWSESEAVERGCRLARGVTSGGRQRFFEGAGVDVLGG